ncbi:MAG: glycosyltransferase family 2 protein [Sphingobacteriia bacterium]|nr:MAG: glycosyltransferase family 2 protein [Sphingobacteriia bacterium]
MKTVFWISLFIVFYTYVGYAIILFALVKIKQVIKGHVVYCSKELPSLTVLVAAYNEEGIIAEKILNTLSLRYPENKIAYIFITDGSSDNTPNLVAQFPVVLHLYQNIRAGKMAAIERALAHVTSDVIVFTDANTMLNQEALINIARHYQDPNVGAVAGEKRVEIPESADATAGEGIYWKYESTLKQWDSLLNTVVGAAGELFSIRTQLYTPIEKDTLLDDFMISMRIAQKGFRIVYEPGAYAVETASANTHEELKRKIRIGAGGLQSTIRLWPLLLPFKQPLLSFQFISHRILRWTLCPLALILLLISNAAIVLISSAEPVYLVSMLGQVIFYLAAMLGWYLAQRSIKVKALFVPYYFSMMNYAVVAGWFRYMSGHQSVLWEKAIRKP